MTGLVRIFETAISCDQANLDRLRSFKIPDYIKVIGHCSQPKHVAGREIVEIIQEKSILTTRLRNKRDTFSTPSVYNFTGAIG